jgi:hypothetical protein
MKLPLHNPILLHVMTHRLMDNFTCPCRHTINNVADGFDFVLLTAVIMKYNTHENRDKLYTDNMIVQNI